MSKVELRSQQWFGKTGKDGFIYRAWMKNQGIPDDYFQGKPVIGICNTWSELTPCNSHMREIADFVKRGVWEAGGLPLEFPAMSLGETQMRPTAMLFRNLLAMEVEESIRGNPIDGVVLLGGCDKTTPGQLMGDFVKGRPSTEFGSVVPSFRPAVHLTDLATSLPDYAIVAMREIFGDLVNAPAFLSAIERAHAALADPAGFALEPA